MHLFVSTLLVFTMAFEVCLAQPRVQKIRQITTHDGLSTPGVKFIYKDSKGFMWFAFSTGINRYDGYTVNRFEGFLPDSMAINSYKYCTSFAEDKEGNLWIGTLKNGFAKLDPKTETFTYYNEDPFDTASLGYNTIHCMILDSEGALWLGSGGKGLFKFFPEADSFINYNPVSVLGHPYAGNIHSLMEDRTGKLWVGTGYGIAMFDRVTETFTPLPHGHEIPDLMRAVNRIVEDASGDLWFGTFWGVFRYNPEQHTWTHYDTEIPGKPDDMQGKIIDGLVEIISGNSHHMWISSRSGVMVYDFMTDRLDHFRIPEEDPESPVSGGGRYLFYDGQLVWASPGGITLIDPRENAFRYKNLHSWPDSLFEVGAWSFFEDRKKTLWAGTFQDGLYEFDSNLEFVANYKPPIRDKENRHIIEKNYISLVFEDSKEHLWVGNAGQGLSLFDRHTKSFIPVYFETAPGIVNSAFVFDILEDSGGGLWFATHTGIYKTDLSWHVGEVLRPVSHPVLSGTSVSDLMEDSRGRLWVATVNRGVFCLAQKNHNAGLFKQYFHEFYNPGLFTVRNIRQLYEDVDGTLWMRSESALFRYDEEQDTIMHHGHFSALHAGEQFEFTGDGSGNLWFISQMGLVRYDPKQRTGKSLKVFGRSEGLYYDEIVHTPFLKSRTGHFFIGGGGSTGSGFCRFHPDSVQGDNLHIPQLVLTGFRIRNEEAGLDSSIIFKEHLRLKYNQNFFSFEFAALDYRDPSKNQFAYRLEGYDEDWIQSGNRRFANYTGVPPGDYVFRVKGSNNDGYWNEEGTSVRVSVLPPPWKTGWAYALYALIFTGLVYGWRRYDLKRIRLVQQLELKHLEAEKLAELDKMKSRFFTNITHEFRTPLTLVLGPLEKLRTKTSDAECLEDLDIVERNARRLHELINQLLSLAKLEAGQMKLQARKENLSGLVKGYVNSFESLARQKEIELTFITSKEDLPLYVDWDKIEKILYNLLSNAFKFTGPGGKIAVDIASLRAAKEGQNEVILKISDTGKGILPGKLAHIFERFYQADDSDTREHEGTGIGLALTKELVELHHGSITAESEEGKGTTFTVVLPAGRAHLSPDEIAGEPATKRTILFESQELAGSIPDTDDPGEVLSPTGIDGPDDEDRPVLLIVEDNADLRRYLRGCLGDAYRIVEAADGERGLAKAIEYIPDLVISDVMMPKMDGYRLCERLKTDEKTSHIPVILLTARANLESKIEGLESGADDFVSKPFDAAEMQVRVRNLIRQRRKLSEQLMKRAGQTGLSGLPDLPGTGITTLEEKFLQKCQDIILQNLADADFGVEKFAELMALSRSQCYRKLNALTHLSPNEFIRFIRLRRAAELLSGTSANVAGVAYDVGFNNPSYFAECFKKQFGVLPSEFPMENQ